MGEVVSPSMENLQLASLRQDRLEIAATTTGGLENGGKAVVSKFTVMGFDADVKMTSTVLLCEGLHGTPVPALTKVLAKRKTTARRRRNRLCRRTSIMGTIFRDWPLNP